MNLQNIFQKLGLGSLPKHKKIEKQNIVALSVAILLFVAIGILALDGYVFYSTVLTKHDKPISSSQIIFPKNELNNFIQFLDRREQQFKNILSGKQSTSTPVKGSPQKPR